MARILVIEMNAPSERIDRIELGVPS